MTHKISSYGPPETINNGPPVFDMGPPDGPSGPPHGLTFGPPLGGPPAKG